MSRVTASQRDPRGRGEAAATRRPSDPAAAPALATLAALPTATLNPAIFDRNLTALQTVDTDLAERLRAQELPAQFSPVVALDGWTTWRIDAPIGRAFIDQSAAPLTRARGLLARHFPGATNPTLPSIDSGATLAVLLEQLPPHAAVFVVEQDFVRLRAVLTAHDFAEAFAGGRVILIAPPTPAPPALAAALEWVLTDQPGLLPPGNIFRLPIVPESIAHELHAAINAAVTNCVPQRDAAAATARAEIAATATDQTRPATDLSVLCPDPQTAAPDVGDAIATGAAAAGLHATALHADRPAHVGPLPFLTHLATRRPHATLLVNAATDDIPTPGTGYTYLLDATTAHYVALPGAGVLLAGTPTVRAVLERRGVQSERVHDFPIAAPDADLSDREQATSRAAAVETKRVLLLGRSFDLNPAAWGVKQPTHQLIWRAACDLLRENWTARLSAFPVDLLRQAERAAGVTIDDADFRTQFTTLLALRVTPTVLRAQLSAALQAAGYEVQTPNGGVAPNRSAGCFVWDRAAAPPRLVCSIGAPDPLDPDLLRAAGRGWPVALHEPGNQTERGKALGDILQRETHYCPFTSVRDMRQLLDDHVRRAATAARAAEHVRRRHTWKVRFTALWSDLTAQAGKPRN